jgi:hypothetical protein
MRVSSGFAKVGQNGSSGPFVLKCGIFFSLPKVYVKDRFEITCRQPKKNDLLQPL